MMHEFSLVLDRPTTEAECNRLYEAGLEDGTISTIAGVSRIDVGREADSMESAIRQAIGQVGLVGLVVTRVEIEAAQFASQR
jgi:hypothetical protein